MSRLLFSFHFSEESFKVSTSTSLSFRIVSILLFARVQLLPLYLPDRIWTTRWRSGQRPRAVVFSATCHPVRVLRGAFIFGEGEKGEGWKGREELQRRTSKGSPRYFISACLHHVARGKKDRGFESLKRWIMFPERSHKFLCLSTRRAERMRLEIPFFQISFSHFLIFLIFLNFYITIDSR